MTSLVKLMPMSGEPACLWGRTEDEITHGLPVIAAADVREASTANGLPTSPEIVEAMLRCIPPSCKRAKWLTVCGGLITAPVTDPSWNGLELFIRWSRGDLHGGVVPPNFQSDDDCIAQWQRDLEKQAKGEAVPTFGALVNLAREHGYTGPSHSIASREIFADFLTAQDDRPRDATNSRAIVLRSEEVQDRREPQRMLVEGFLPEHGTVSIHGVFGSYKSFTVQDALLSVASGVPMFNHFKVNRSGAGIYLAGEGLAGFEFLRRPVWKIARGISQPLPIYTIEGVPQVRSADDIARYIDAIAAHNEKPCLLVIDPVARAMAGLNENDAGDANLYLEMVEAMAKAFRCCVLSIMHEGKDESRGARGSSAFAAGFDNVWRQEADLEARTIKLSPVKLKDDAGVEPIFLKGRQVLVPKAGKTSLVFDWLAPDDFAAREGGLTNAMLGKALKALHAENGKTTTTRVLATELAGPDADEQVVLAFDKRLRRGAKMRFRAYVAHFGEGRGDATLWTFPKIENEGARP